MQSDADGSRSMRLHTLSCARWESSFAELDFFWISFGFLLDFFWISFVSIRLVVPGGRWRSQPFTELNFFWIFLVSASLRCLLWESPFAELDFFWISFGFVLELAQSHTVGKAIWWAHNFSSGSERLSRDNSLL